MSIPNELSLWTEETDGCHTLTILNGHTELVSIRMWEITSKKNIATFWNHTTDVQDLQFSPDGTCLASAGHDGVIFLWDLTPYL